VTDHRPAERLAGDRPAATARLADDRAAAGELPLVAAWQQITHRLLAALDHELADLGLSAAEINALACFAGSDARTVRELVAATAQRPSTLTGVLDRLERRGLVARAANPADRRSILVRLTPAGHTSADRVADAFAAVEARLPAADLRRVLARIHEAV
jgi:MarR family transcriptional regulator, organic hydroperoxide resistance regulator